MEQARRAAELARSLLAKPLPDRWAHTQGVARQARSLTRLAWVDVDTLEAAAWLHDIGYSPDLVNTGFHPLDGARHLRALGNFSPIIQTLVAQHSCATAEAEERRLAAELETEFPISDNFTDELVTGITYCDMTTSPLGALVSVDERLGEIWERYSPVDIVHRSIRKAESTIRQNCKSIEAQLSIK
jgi:hypothetical protein